MINMNLKKYEKLRKKIEYQPVEWLDFSVREYNFCKNHRIECIHQLIDTNLVHNIRGFSVMKVFRLLTATLKRKIGIDFEFIGIGDGIFRIIPKFIFETKKKQNLVMQMQCLNIQNICKNIMVYRKHMSGTQRRLKQGIPEQWQKKESLFFMDGFQVLYAMHLSIIKNQQKLE